MLLNGWCPKSLASGVSANALGGDEPTLSDAARRANDSYRAASHIRIDLCCPFARPFSEWFEHFEKLPSKASC